MTDDVSIVEHLQHPVYITEGSYTNIKVVKNVTLYIWHKYKTNTPASDLEVPHCIWKFILTKNRKKTNLISLNYKYVAGHNPGWFITCRKNIKYEYLESLLNDLQANCICLRITFVQVQRSSKMFPSTMICSTDFLCWNMMLSNSGSAGITNWSTSKIVQNLGPYLESK